MRLGTSDGVTVSCLGPARRMCGADGGVPVRGLARVGRLLSEIWRRQLLRKCAKITTGVWQIGRHNPLDCTDLLVSVVLAEPFG